jgi:16S rRNA C967 or C1407 C5-methylase (RsmB/RsmF family)
MPGKFIEVHGEVLRDNIVTRCPWVPAWIVAADGASLSKNASLKPLAQFLAEEVALGNIVRQELVSMIPVQLLDVQSHHMVLDMCAAPGSKTEEVLAVMKRRLVKQQPLQHPTGIVVANDADPKRMGSIQRRYQRCGDPNLVLTCCRAEDLQERLGQGIFDRIICDVPCTGDGTFRKCPHLWRLFRFLNSCGISTVFILNIYLLLYYILLV